jgi:hypothetical protein
MFDMSNDSHLFHNKQQLGEEGFQLRGNIFEKGQERYLPLYEAKMIHQFDHRWATYDGEDARDVTEQEKQNPNFEPLPRYWVHESEVNKAIPETWDKPWLMGWRDICRSTDERTVIASLVPRVGVGNKIPLIYSQLNEEQCLCLIANVNSLVFDYVARQKVGGTTLNFFIMKQFPLLSPSAFYGNCPWESSLRIDAYLNPRVKSLMEFSSATQDWFPGKGGKLNQWEHMARANTRAELDAAFFHLYGLSRDDVAFVLEQFPVLSRNDEARHGEFLTKRLVLECYDRLSSGQCR